LSAIGSSIKSFRFVSVFTFRFEHC
jgi:hypothetical protein